MNVRLSLEIHPVLKLVDKKPHRQLAIQFELDRVPARIELCAMLGDGQVTRMGVHGKFGRNRLKMWIPEVTDKVDLRVELTSDARVLARVNLKVSPCRQWSVHLLHQSHFDFGYTTLQPDILRLQISNLDTVLEYIDATKNYPEAERFRWNAECCFPLLKYLESRPASILKRLLQADRDGLFEVAALPFTMHSEGCSQQELLRSLYPVKHLRELGFSIRTAVQTDVTGVSSLLPKLLNNVGVRHLAMAPNNYRAPFHERGSSELPRPFIWQAPYGGELLTWFTDLYDHCYQEGNCLGFLENLECVEERIGSRLLGLEESGFPWRTVGLRTQGSYSDNGRPNLKIAEVVRAWNETYVFPKIRMSTFHQFFSELESETSGRLRTIRAFWPDWWNDGIGSMAREFSTHRRSQEIAEYSQTAIALAVGGMTNTKIRSLIEDTWQNILLSDEHTWGAASPLENAETGSNAGGKQADYKRSFFFQAALQAEQSEGAARAMWAMTLSPRDYPVLVIQNALSWVRSGQVDVELVDLEQLIPGAKSWRFFDEGANVELSSQLLFKKSGSVIRIFVDEVPAFGQRAFRVERGEADLPSFEKSFMDRNTWRGYVKNGEYSLESCPISGGISQWMNEKTGRVLADDRGPFLLGNLIHQKFLRRHGTFFIKHEIASSSREDDCSIESLEEGPLFDRLVLKGKCGLMGVRREVLLYHTDSRVDITTTITKAPSTNPEAVFMALPLKIESATCVVGTNGGPMIPGQDQIPGSSSDWFVVREHVDVTGPKGGVMIALPDSPLVQLGDITQPSVRGTGNNPCELFIYVLNNLWPTNFAGSQGGEYSFRVSLMDYTHEFNVAWSKRRAIECNSPLRYFPMGPNHKDKDDVKGRFPIEIIATENLMASLHPLDGGVGMHIEEFSSEPGAIKIQFLEEVTARVLSTNLVDEEETELHVEDGCVNVQIEPNEMRTLRMEISL